MARGDLNLFQGGLHERGAGVSDREIEAAVLRVLVNRIGLSERTVLLLQELAGERGEGGRAHAAVRRSDLEAIGRIPELASKHAGAAPTAAQFNALRDDVRKLYEALEAIARATRGS